MGQTGWIKLHRKLLDNPIFENPKLLKVWIWCLLKASHSPNCTLVGLQKVELLEGQFLFGRSSAASELSLSESTCYRYLIALEKLKMLSLKRTTKYTLVTVENWGVYQSRNEEDEQQMNNKRTTNEQQMNTNKNVKNIKNVNNNIKKENQVKEKKTSGDDELDIALDRFREHRSNIKKPITEYGIGLIIKKLNKLEPNNIDKQIEIINQSIENGWQGVFALGGNNASVTGDNQHSEESFVLGGLI